MLRRSLPLLLSTAAFVLASYATNLFLARHLGPAQYGVIGVVTSLLSALNTMQTTGVPTAIAKLVAEDERTADDVLVGGLRLQGGLALVLMALMIGLSPLLARLFHVPDLVGYLVITALILPGYGAFTVFGGVWNGLQRFGRSALINASYAVAKLVLVVVLAEVAGVAGALAGFALATVVAAAVGARRPRRAGHPVTRPLVALAAPLVAFAVLQLLQYQVDLFTVKAVIHDATQAGFYVSAQNVSVIPFLGLAAINQVALPSVSRLVATEGRVGAAPAVTTALRTQLLLLLPATALIAGGARSVVLLLFGPRYAPAIPVLRLLVTAYLFVTTLSLLCTVLAGAGRAKAAMAWAGVALAVTFGLCLVLVPTLRLDGGAYGVGAGGLVGTVGALVSARRTVPFAVPVASTARIAVVSAAMLGLAWVPLPPVAIVGTWPALALLGAAGLVLVREVTADERAQVRALLRRRTA